jgi:hypothetical protein
MGDVLGLGDITAGGSGDVLLAAADGGVTVIEAGNRPIADRVYRVAPPNPGVRVVAPAPADPDDLTGLLAIGAGGELLVFRHSGVFWGQDPDLAFLAPLPLATGFGSYDIIG